MQLKGAALRFVASDEVCWENGANSLLRNRSDGSNTSSKGCASAIAVLYVKYLLCAFRLVEW